MRQKYDGLVKMSQSIIFKSDLIIESIIDAESYGRYRIGLTFSAKTIQYIILYAIEVWHHHVYA